MHVNIEESSRYPIAAHDSSNKLIRRISFCDQENPPSLDSCSPKAVMGRTPSINKLQGLLEETPKGLMRMNEGLAALDLIEEELKNPKLPLSKKETPTKSNMLDIKVDSGMKPIHMDNMDEGIRELQALFDHSPKGLMRMNEGLDKVLDELERENPTLLQQVQRRNSIKSPRSLPPLDKVTKMKTSSEQAIIVEESPKGLMRMNEGLKALDEIMDETPKGILRMNEGLKALELLDDLNYFDS